MKSFHLVRSSRKKNKAPIPQRTVKTPTGLEIYDSSMISIRNARANNLKGVDVDIPKGKWGVITPEDLEKARPKIEPNDIVIVNTGWHHHFGDNTEYFWRAKAFDVAAESPWSSSSFFVNGRIY